MLFKEHVFHWLAHIWTWKNTYQEAGCILQNLSGQKQYLGDRKEK
jgi:hypothetical protein